jgi:ATP-dependent Clp protease ATP-binding subunit ClpA
LRDIQEVSTAAAVFILVSDLGEESLDPSMGREAAKMAVRNATRQHWPTAKLPKFVHEIVPFLPLTTSEMARVAELELIKYRDELQVRSLPTGSLLFGVAVHLCTTDR